MSMPIPMYGSVKRPTPMLCGGWTECDEAHNMWKPEDVMVLTEAIHLEDVCDEHAAPDVVARAVRDGLLIEVPDRNVVVPTVLGMWLEDCAAN